MSTHTLTIQYSAASVLFDPYWIRIEQDKVDDGATVSDTAAALDALYQIDPCIPPEEPEEPAAPVAAEEATEKIAEVVDLPACDMEPDGSVDVDIRIYRSHLAEPYVLRLRGGSVVQTVQESGTVNFSAEISETLTLEAPVVDGFTCTPAPVSRTGNTLRFSANQVGQICRATYQSQWDRVTVKVHGVNGEPGECRALAFHHGLAAAHELELPEIAELDRSLCPETRWQFTPTDYEVTCYKDVLVTRRCTCSGAEVDQRVEQQVVPCPNQQMRCPNNQTTCMHLLGTDAIDEWVECDGDSDIPGMPGRSYAVSTPEFYREMCCKEPGVTLPACPIKRTTYKAELPIEHGEEFWRGLYGKATRFVPVPPAGGICGEWIIEQALASGCCNGIPAPVWDNDASVEVIADSSSGVVVWSATMAPYTVTVEGSGFWLDLGGAKKTITTSNPFATIYTTIACGPCTVTITDACDRSVVGAIRSPNGKWVQVEYVENLIDHEIHGSGEYIGIEPIYCSAETIVGKYKVLKRSMIAVTKDVGGVSAPASWACSGQTLPGGCSAMSPAGIPAVRPAVGHDPGNCSIDAGANCTAYWMDIRAPYCAALVYYPGRQWTVWEWQC